MDETLHPAILLLRTVFRPPVSRFETQTLATRLVKSEIVPPYYGILINTSFGYLTYGSRDPLATGEF